MSARRPGTNDLDVIIIGAGAIGCCTAWHLAELGCRVLVVDSSSGPARQSTRYAAGFVGCLSGVHKPSWGRELAELQLYGIDFYRQLAQRTTRDIGFRPVGITYLFLTDEGWSDHQGRIERSRQFGCRVELLDRSRSTELLPMIEFNRLRGAVYLEDGVRVSSPDAIAALATETVEKGVNFAFNTPVLQLLVENGRACGVLTQKGPIEAPAVVIAAGAWTRPFLKAHSTYCPVQPCIETRFTTPPLPGILPDMPLLVFRDWQRFYIREELGGLLIGGGDHTSWLTDRYVDPDQPPKCDDIPPHQAYRIRELLREIEPVMPVLRNVEIQTIGSGLPTFTDDSLFIVDELDNCSGAIFMAGCQEAGVTHGPGLGRCIAEWIATKQRPSIAYLFRLSRFAKTYQTGYSTEMGGTQF